MTKPRPAFVKSAHRVFEILEYFDRDRQSATVSEISRELAYPNSSTAELLHCMSRLGYLHYNRTRRTYSPTARVALLGSWVDRRLFRGGVALDLVDEIAVRTGETVVLSTGAVAFHIHHTHVVPGRGEDAVMVRSGGRERLLQCPQGELLLASYPPAQIQLALKRMNADAEDPGQRVDVAKRYEDLLALGARGYCIATGEPERGFGAVCMLLPRARGTDRVVVSVVATSEKVARSGEQILHGMLESRSRMSCAVSAETIDLSARRAQRYGGN
jgi:DNA-binding IclR family transcriptional regulator